MCEPRQRVGPSKQLLVAGGHAVTEAVGARLEGRGFEVELFSNGVDCVRRFSGDGADLVVLCLPLDDVGGADVIRDLRGIDPLANVVVAGRDHQIQGPAQAFQLDALEYIEDPVRNGTELLGAVGSALGARRIDVHLRYLKEKHATGASWASLIGTSREMREVVDKVRRVGERTTSGAPPTILIRGETGTGKGLLAKCIHYNGVRRNQAFVEINCAAIPATLLESELFGFERGAFTDAKTSKAGLFETANQGTLFLDEIASLGIDLQAKLLTAIEEKRIRRIGGRHAVQFDVQIVAASHMDLGEKVRTGAFRADLYHRLNVVSVVLPPLRARGADKLVLARVFIESICKEYGIPPRNLSADAEQYIMEYSWPGNVRELRNQIERVLLVGNDDELILGDQFERPSIPPASYRPASNRPESSRPASSRPTSNGPITKRNAFSMTLPEEGIGLEEVERELIKRALARFEGNVSRAARFLKISRQTLMYRIKKHGME